MPPTVPSASENAASETSLPRSSVFISYASENREAARLLRDALLAEGLDVWYDENELGGGDAWDQKIRRQIRECTFFMPVISAQTEARREGYFRREWRLAVDRSHDMADDAMFLIPVVIDSTAEGGARVPEKFLTVQWLKVPGGVATPGLKAVAKRLASGDHLSVPPVAPPPISPIRKPVAESPAAAKPATTREPIPSFPSKPEGNHDRAKYLVDVIAWLFNVVRITFQRMPRWVRVLVIIWLVLVVVGKSCSSSSSEDNDHRTSAEQKALKAKSLSEAAQKLEQVAGDPSNVGLKSDIAKAGAEMARVVADEVAGTTLSAHLSLVPFEADPADAKGSVLGKAVFNTVFSQFTQAKASLVRVQPAVAGGDKALCEAAKAAGDDFVAAGKIEGTNIEVRLLSASSGETVWTGSYSTSDGDSDEAADQVYRGLLAAISHRTKSAPAP